VPIERIGPEMSTSSPIPKPQKIPSDSNHCHGKIGILQPFTLAPTITLRLVSPIRKHLPLTGVDRVFFSRGLLGGGTVGSKLSLRTPEAFGPDVQHVTFISLRQHRNIRTLNDAELALLVALGDAEIDNVKPGGVEFGVLQHHFSGQGHEQRKAPTLQRTAAPRADPWEIPLASDRIKYGGLEWNQKITGDRVKAAGD
jgi:hypothetical protein